MPRFVEEPVTTTECKNHNDSVTRHPAFAQISASRVSGRNSLYDSDFVHQHFMTISIKRSELHRGLNRDWHFGREELIEVALSEAQWATFVSSPNQGSGVPCTLERFNGQMVPGLPDPKSRVDQFGGELRARLAKCMRMIDEVNHDLGNSSLSKSKQAPLVECLRLLKQELQANLPFVAEQFGEHMEKTVEKAKAEVHGYMTNVIQRAGLEALSGGQLPLEIGVEKDD